MYFEMDPGSGLRDVCGGREVTFQDTPSNMVRAVIDDCGMIGRLLLRGAVRDHIAVVIRDLSPICDQTKGSPEALSR
jgi:hypothetical protein